MWTGESLDLVEIQPNYKEYKMITPNVFAKPDNEEIKQFQALKDGTLLVLTAYYDQQALDQMKRKSFNKSKSMKKDGTLDLADTTTTVNLTQDKKAALDSQAKIHVVRYEKMTGRFEVWQSVTLEDRKSKERFSF